MKLRYLHLQDYPPIKDIKVLFASGSPLQRECAIRFVVGVNGSGKSNLLRALAEVFLALSEQRVPPFPVSLVYELGQKGSANHRTLLLHCPGKRTASSLWVAERAAFSDQGSVETFETAIQQLSDIGTPSGLEMRPLIDPGSWPTVATTPPTMALPNAVLAYTTGAIAPWQAIWNRSSVGQDSEESFSLNDEPNDMERPPGWNTALELASQNLTGPTSAIDSGLGDISPTSDLFRRPILLTPALLKCALLVVALPQAFVDTDDNPNLPVLNGLLAGIDGRDGEYRSPLQEMLQRGGWHHLVSVAFRCHIQPEVWRLNRKLEIAHDWLMCAGEVITEPHPTPTEAKRTLYFDLKGGFSSYSETLSINDNLQISGTQGEALWALLGGHESTAFELFTKFVDLYQAGLFDDVELRLRRSPKPDESADRDAVENDVGVLRYEELSDGEQMVLGRMALFHLLEGQHDSLLLLDEPETHFNDKWKREVVDIIDTSIGRTANDVLISTHSSIVLSDVFNDEIIMVEKSDDGSVIRTVTEQTFATDPSALMMTVFEADDSIGKRAQEFIEDRLRKATGTAADIQQLEQLIARMGSGFYRSELRTLLNKWKGAGDA
ncbi:AAA family ATPase [Methylomonas sp. MED-D]|uniref:AAA family ATPase n=1 Tax=Methylomonas sp. MED-D TaxID=3418768 RepID=UPI003D066CCE